MADTGITLLIPGSGLEGPRPEEDVGITIKAKLEMACAHSLPVAFATGMQDELCSFPSAGRHSGANSLS